MARLLFGGTNADWVFTTAGADGDAHPDATAAATFWDALSGGNQYGAAPMPGGVDDGTGLLDGTGTPISTVTLDGNGFVPGDAVQGPDGITRMAIDASGGAGPRRWIYPNDPVALSTALQTRVTDLETQVADIYAQLATCLRYVIQNSDGTWPVLPDAVGSAAAAWLGLYTSAQPPLDDGTHARSGSDVLLGPTP